jgi:hypothetical protein
MQGGRRRKTTQNLVGGKIQTNDGCGMKGWVRGRNGTFKVAFNSELVVVATIPYHGKAPKLCQVK